MKVWNTASDLLYRHQLFYYTRYFLYYQLVFIVCVYCMSLCVSQGERDAMRTKVKHLKELMVQEGFVETKIKVGVAPPRPGAPLRDEIMTSIQDCLEDLKRSITEVVECWNIL